MQRRFVGAICSSLIVLGGCPALAPGGTATGATLRVTLSPLVVRGTHFRAAERVKVTVRIGSETRVRTAVANASGSFTSTFGPIQFDRCSTGFSALAVGGLGDRASYKLPQPQCTP